MITQLTDFRVEIDIPQATVSPSNENVQFMINKYEPIFLNELFGETFAALFIAGINPPVTDPITPVDARWTALLNLPGFKTAIANYIYYYWMRYQAVQNFGTGTGKSKDTNSVSASPADKMRRAWFEMYVINWKTLRYLYQNATTYPEYVAPKWANAFMFIWCNDFWNWSIDIFTSSYWLGWYGCYRLPDIFIPLGL